ncbi:MAG: TonB-dependent receptor [Rariglobus sp.]
MSTLLRFTLGSAVGLATLVATAASDVLELDSVEVRGTAPEYTRLSSPVTSTAYSGAFLDTIDAQTFGDVSPLVPGLFISEQSITNSSYNLRGITTDNTDVRLAQRVGLFIDGVPLYTNGTFNVAIFDVDRVDVIKGPQASVLAAPTQIGAISSVSNRPTNETSSEFTVGLGDYNSRLASGTVNVPLVTDKLLARLAVTGQQVDGYVDNRLGGNLQGRETTALRGSLRWQPSANTTADLIVGFQRDTPTGTAFQSMVIPDSTGVVDFYDDAELNRGSALGAERSIVSVTGIVSHKLNETWTASTNTGWRDTDLSEEFDADGSRFFLIEAGEYTRARQFTQELRFTYDANERLRANIGGFASWRDATQRVPLRTDQNLLVLFLTGAPAPIPLPTFYEETVITSADTLAGDVFGDVSFKLTDRLTVGANARVGRERTTSGYESLAASTPSIPILPTAGGGNSFFAPTGGRLESTRNDNFWVGGVNASFELTPSHVAYSSVGRGRRPPNTTFAQGPTFEEVRLKEEVVWNFETGIKGMLLDRRVGYDFAVFHYRYDHFQTETSSGGVTTPTDGGRASANGFEVTLNAKANDYINVFSTYGYTDASFANRDEDGNPQAFAGNTFRLTSLYTFSLGATFTLPLDGAGAFFFTPVWQYRSGHYFEDDNDSNGGSLQQAGYGLVNLRTGYRTKDQNWEFVFWVRNLLDREYLIDAGNIGGTFGLPTSIRGAPRMMGVNVTARF